MNEHSTEKIAILFPGQGSQSIGMCLEVSRHYSIIEETFDEASEALGYDLWKIVQSGPAKKLNETEITQPAILTASIALWRAWQSSNNISKSSLAYLAGHSLGEYSALVCAQVISFDAGVKLAAARGGFMQNAVAMGEGGMAAIVGLANESIEQICRRASNNDSYVTPANFNSPGQVVVAGHVDAVKHAITLAKHEGAKLAKLLPMSVPSHCDLMGPAAEQLQEYLQRVTMTTPVIPIIHNVDVKNCGEVEAVKKALVKQLTQPVRWQETIEFIYNQGVNTMIECGPGKVLQGLCKRINRDINTQSVENNLQVESET